MPNDEDVHVLDLFPSCLRPYVLAAACVCLGKTPVIVGNCMGFAANRIFFPYMQAACMLVERGVSPYEIDHALRKFG